MQKFQIMYLYDLLGIFFLFSDKRFIVYKMSFIDLIYIYIFLLFTLDELILIIILSMTKQNNVTSEREKKNLHHHVNLSSPKCIHTERKKKREKMFV